MKRGIEMAKCLIAFYSWSGNTRGVAEAIAGATGGDLFEIEPQTAYTQSYNACVTQAKKEIQEGFLPPLKATREDIAEYDVVFIGTPNWWSSVAPPVATFLSGADLQGKTVVPFCSHGGGGGRPVEAAIRKLCPGAAVAKSFDAYGEGGDDLPERVAAWIAEIGVL